MAVYTRAHETGADLLERPGRCDSGRRRRRLRFSLKRCWRRFGATMEAAISASADTAVASGGRCGVISKLSEILQH